MEKEEWTLHLRTVVISSLKRLRRSAFIKDYLLLCNLDSLNKILYKYDRCLHEQERVCLPKDQTGFRDGTTFDYMDTNVCVISFGGVSSYEGVVNDLHILSLKNLN